MSIIRNRFLSEDVVKWREEMFCAMEKDPDFRRDVGGGPARVGLQEERARAFKQCVKALALIGETMDPFERKSKLVALQMYDPSLEVKVALLKDMPISAIMGSGTQGTSSIKWKSGLELSHTYKISSENLTKPEHSLLNRIRTEAR